MQICTDCLCTRLTEGAKHKISHVSQIIDADERRLFSSSVRGECYQPGLGANNTAVYQEQTTTVVYESESRFAFATEAMVPDPREALHMLCLKREEYLGRRVNSTDVIKHKIPEEVLDDLNDVWRAAKDPQQRQACEGSLQLLQLDFRRYSLLNRQREYEENTNKDATDFYSVLKVDCHLHCDAMWISRQLLQFLKEKYNSEGHVSRSDGKTIREIMDEAGCSFGGDERVTVDSLRTEANYMMFRNFSHFNASFNPMGSSELRDICFGYDNNVVDGKWAAELTSMVCCKAAADNVLLEPRFTIFGRNRNEWYSLAAWAQRSNLYQHSSLRWAVQMPRIYQVWRAAGELHSFGEMLSNFFTPLFEATLHPTAEKNKALARLMSDLVLFDTVDDESKDDSFTKSDQPPPDEWLGHDNPNYAYYAYYFWVNIAALNTLRRDRGLNTFQFRPHCGEAGPSHHLASGFLFAHGISHGIKLAGEPVLQYLYYLCQIGISMSPISNRVLFVKYTDSPFNDFFERGLRCTLTTDDPMQFHQTETPLMEEYSVARNVWDLTSTDLSEIARSSVLISFGEKKGQELLGNDDPNVTNVAPCRLAFRAQQLAKARAEWLQQ